MFVRMLSKWPRAVPAGSMKRTTSQSSEAARASLARLARQTTEDINSRQTVPLPAEQVTTILASSLCSPVTRQVMASC